MKTASHDLSRVLDEHIEGAYNMAMSFILILIFVGMTVAGLGASFVIINEMMKAKKAA